MRARTPAADAALIESLWRDPEHGRSCRTVAAAFSARRGRGVSYSTVNRLRPAGVAKSRGGTPCRVQGPPPSSTPRRRGPSFGNGRASAERRFAPARRSAGLWHLAPDDRLAPEHLLILRAAWSRLGPEAPAGKVANRVMLEARRPVSARLAEAYRPRS